MLPRRYFREFDWMFDRLFPERMKSVFDDQSVWAPTLEVFERKGEFVVRADLPGLKKEDITIEVTDRELILKGERTREKEEKNENFYRAEREYGTFLRTIPLPEGVKAEDAKAVAKDGVLEIRMPLAKALPGAKRLEIQEAAAPAPEKAKTAA